MDYGNPSYSDRLEIAASTVLVPYGQTPADVAAAVYDLINVSSTPADLAGDLTGHPTQNQIDIIKRQTAAEVVAAGGDDNAVNAANSAIDASISQSGGTAEQAEASAGDSLKLFGLSAGVIVVLVLVFLILFELKK